MVKTIALAMLVGGLALANGSGVFAQSPPPATPPTQDGKAMQPGMMNGQGGMMNGQMMQQMTTMMENCNKMMESKMQNQPANPATGKQG
jgi:hypothetical protein